MKKILLFLCLIFLTGCSVRYHINFNDDTFLEKISFSDGNEMEYDHIKKGEFAPVPAFEDSPYSVEDPVKLDGVEYYNVGINEGQIQFDYVFDISNYAKAYSVNRCFDSFKVFQEEDDIIISTNKGFNCFFPGRNLQNVDVVITSNHEVLYNNADEINGDEYIWHITEDNQDEANIQISFSKDVKKGFFNKIDFDILKVILFFAGFASIVSIVSILIFIRYRRVNKI